MRPPSRSFSSQAQGSLYSGLVAVMTWQQPITRPSTTRLPTVEHWAALTLRFRLSADPTTTQWCPTSRTPATPNGTWKSSGRLTTRRATLGYVGNHGSNLAVQQNGINAYCTVCPFGTLPTSAPDPRFGRVRELTNQGISNYNGLTATLTRRVTKGFQGSINYTWSHALDDISNAGFDQYSLNTAGEAFLYQVDPQNLRKYNYGNSDYDFRQNFSASYIYEMPSAFKENRLLNSVVGGWVTSGVIYKRTGQPYSVVDTSLTSQLIGNNAAGEIMPYFLGGSIPACKVDIRCLNPAQFTETGQNTFGNISRNQFRGPGYFDMDMTIKKNIRITESGLTFSMGANAYNVLNHPRFANPDNNFANAGSTFGQIQSTVTPASSPYGNFQGSAVSGRVLQLELEVKF